MAIAASRTRALYPVGASPNAGPPAYLLAFAFVAGSTLAGEWIAPRWGTAPVDMIYLPAVLAAAALWGLWPGLFAGGLAALAYNFFFTEPIHTFRMDRGTDVVTVTVLLVVAVVTSRLGSAIRTQATIASAHAMRNATIAGFAGRLLSCADEKEIAEAACQELSGLFACNAIIVSGSPVPHPMAAVPPSISLTPSDIAAAALAIETGVPAGRGTARMQPTDWVLYPISSADSVIAAAGLARDDGKPPVFEEQRQLLASLLDQVALAMERSRLERQSRDFASLRERDRLRSSLLSSIGQDIGPAITAIGAAARQLRRSGGNDKNSVMTVESEASRLARYIDNLLELEPASEQRPIDAGHVRIDLFQRLVFKDRKPVHLTPKEYLLLAELAKHPGRVLGRDHLLRTVWGPAQEAQIEYLRVAIRALRQKLEQVPSEPRLIINEPGVGYRLSVG